jgi:hypothetical protein
MTHGTDKAQGTEHGRKGPLISALPAGFDAPCAASFGGARIHIRITGPLKAGLPRLSWQGGHPMDSSAWRRLRLSLELLDKARELEDPELIAHLATYPVMAALVDAITTTVARETGITLALSKAAYRPSACLRPDGGAA